jgi:hypothetical protein
MASKLQPVRRPGTRLARRRRQRGAAMVEAAFMLPMFVILWYGSLYVHNLGSKYINVNSNARAEAWQTAMANCGVHHDSDSEKLPLALTGGSGLPGNGGNEANQVSTALKSGNVTGAMSGFVSGFTSLISSIFPNPSGAVVTKSDTVNWRVPNLYNHTGLSGESTAVLGSSTVVCNEAPQDGSISNVISGVVSMVQGIL